jgi:hypothetical protein
MRTIPYPVWVVTALLFLSAGLSGAGVLLGVVQLISLLGPGLVIWMVIHVLKDQSVRIRDLGEGEEWGYQDRPDLRPGS